MEAAVFSSEGIQGLRANRTASNSSGKVGLELGRRGPSGEPVLSPSLRM